VATDGNSTNDWEKMGCFESIQSIVQYNVQIRSVIFGHFTASASGDILLQVVKN